LDPSDGNDAVPDEAVPVIEVQREGDVLPAVPEQVAGDSGGDDRIVDPRRSDEPRSSHGWRPEHGEPGEYTEAQKPPHGGAALTTAHGDAGVALYLKSATMCTQRSHTWVS